MNEADKLEEVVSQKEQLIAALVLLHKDVGVGTKSQRKQSGNEELCR